MTDRMPPQADGLYDPRYEHDACGVAMVARLDNVPTPRGRRSARSRRSTTSSTAGPRAPTSAPATAPGSSSSCPTRSSARVVDFELPEPRALRRRRVLPAARRGAPRARSRSCSSSTSASRASASSAGATCPIDEDARRRHGQRLAPAHPPAVHRAPARASSDDQDAFERKLYVIRRIVELAAGPDFYSPSLLLAHAASTRGCSISHQLRGFYPDLQRRALRQRAGAGALALLDEHVPELGARPPVPRDLPQRRDQHADGQRQLDARPRVAARVASCSASTCRRSCRSCAPAARTRRRSTTSSSCSCSPAARCRTRR